MTLIDLACDGDHYFTHKDHKNELKEREMLTVQGAMVFGGVAELFRHTEDGKEQN